MDADDISRAAAPPPPSPKRSYRRAKKKPFRLSTILEEPELEAEATADAEKRTQRDDAAGTVRTDDGGEVSSAVDARDVADTPSEAVSVENEGADAEKRTQNHDEVTVGTVQPDGGGEVHLSSAPGTAEVADTVNVAVGVTAEAADTADVADAEHVADAEDVADRPSEVVATDQAQSEVDTGDAALDIDQHEGSAREEQDKASADHTHGGVGHEIVEALTGADSMAGEVNAKDAVTGADSMAGEVNTKDAVSAARAQSPSEDTDDRESGNETEPTGGDDEQPSAEDVGQRVDGATAEKEPDENSTDSDDTRRNADAAGHGDGDPNAPATGEHADNTPPDGSEACADEDRPAAQWSDAEWDARTSGLASRLSTAVKQIARDERDAEEARDRFINSKRLPRQRSPEPPPSPSWDTRRRTSDEQLRVLGEQYRRVWKIRVFVHNSLDIRELEVSLYTTIGEIVTRLWRMDGSPTSMSYTIKRLGITLHSSWTYGELLWWNSARMIAYRHKVKPITLRVHVPFRRDEFFIYEPRHMDEVFEDLVITKIKHHYGLPRGLFRLVTRRYQGYPERDAASAFSPVYSMPAPNLAREKMEAELKEIRRQAGMVEAYPLVHFARFPRRYTCDEEDAVYELFSDWRPRVPALVDGEFEDDDSPDESELAAGEESLRAFPRGRSFGELGMAPGSEIFLQIRDGFAELLAYLIPGPRRSFFTFHTLVEWLRDRDKPKEELEYMRQVALYVAAHYNALNLIEYLLLRDLGKPSQPVGAHPSMQHRFAYDAALCEAECPVHAAVRQGHLDTVRTFVFNSSTCLVVKDSEGNGVIAIARRCKHRAVLAFLEEEWRHYRTATPKEGRLGRYKSLVGRKETEDTFDLIELLGYNPLDAYSSVSAMRRMTSRPEFRDIVQEVTGCAPALPEKPRRLKPSWRRRSEQSLLRKGMSVKRPTKETPPAKDTGKPTSAPAEKGPRPTAANKRPQTARPKRTTPPASANNVTQTRSWQAGAAANTKPSNTTTKHKKPLTSNLKIHD